MYNYLFNFSSSFSGGGLKRLEEFSKWFSIHGGATFLINKNNSFLIAQYPTNKYIVPEISKALRILNKEKYLDQFESKEWDLYYSYGIPVTRNVAKKNILHISNVLPFVKGGFGHNFIQRARFLLLKYYFIKSFQYIDILSAESEFSIRLFESLFNGMKIISKNGSDDEIDLFLKAKQDSVEKEYSNYAVVLGTQNHKNLEGSYNLFKEIQKENESLRLIIIGNKAEIPKIVTDDKTVELKGILKRNEIMELLSKAKVYISTTLLENSYNAASEAIFLAKESFISTIPPHFELLENFKYEVKQFKSINLESIHLESKDLEISNLIKWEQVIQQIVNIESQCK